MLGDLIGSRPLKGIAAATLLSPAPRVFSAVDGYETYTTRFALKWIGTDGQARRLDVTPEVGARLRGPYNRRNVYGAALSYGPVLAGSEAGRLMLDSILKHAFGTNGPIWEELGIDRDSVSANLRLRYHPRPGIELTNHLLTIEIPLP
jgi:hypothetical protein